MNFYKRHLGDYAKKAGHLSALEHGVLNLILDAYYDREQAPTLTEAVRWARARTDDEKGAVVAVLDEFFTLIDGRYVQARAEEEISMYRQQAESNAKIAAERERRKRERRVDAPSNEQSTNEHEACTTRATNVAEAYQDREPNHKPLATSHKPVTKEKNKDKASPAGDASLFPGVDPQVVADFKALRAKKRAAVTATAMSDIAKQASKAGLSLEAALRICCTRGWAGFEAAWLQPKGVPATSGAVSGDKFRVANLDHSSSRAAMEASMKRHGIVVPEGDDEIAFT